MPRNTQGFMELAGCRATPFGLLPPKSLAHDGIASLLAGAGITPAPPFPQVFRLKHATLVLTETETYAIDESDWTWTNYTTSIYDMFDTTYQYVIKPGGGAWKVIDLGDLAISFNNTNVLFFSDIVLFGQDKFIFKAGCEFRGRILLGDFTDWNEEWAAVAAMVTTWTVPSTVTPGLVWWSKFNADDFIWMFHPITAVYGPIGSTLISNVCVNGTFKYHTGSNPNDWTLNSTANGLVYDSGFGSGPRLVFSGTAGAKTATESLGSLDGATRVLVGYKLTRTAGSFHITVGSKNTVSKTTSGYHFEVLTNPGTGNIVVNGDAAAQGTVTDVVVWTMADTDAYGPDRPFIMDLVHGGDSGFYQTPWQGAVKSLKSLDALVMAYCEDGVEALIPADNPFPMFGGKRVQSPEGFMPSGIATPQGVGGDELVHFFIDQSGCSWRLHQGLQLERLDRSWVFSTGTDHIVTFDPIDNAFYVSMLVDSVWQCVHVSRSGGFSYVDEAPTSLVVIAGACSGIVSPVVGMTFKATTNTLDLGGRVQKRIDEIEVTANGVDRLKLSVMHNDGRSESFMKTPPSQAYNGLVFPRVVDTDFRIQLTGTFQDDGRIDRISVRSTGSEKRG